MGRRSPNEVEDLKTMASDQAVAAVLNAMGQCDDPLDRISVAGYVMGSMFGLTSKTISEGTELPIGIAAMSAMEMMRSIVTTFISNGKPNG